eukprot:TRINITY_DN23858_c0_g1_i3.p1 TRINITY_DN23858_c0_g1~~TRINITY_DN23858_c0_g1_i3.p1  ORF type:complete len:310 (+),score=120.17 TRINITY_DN23858_c0_g1_i3:50-979(+)
MPPRYTKVPPPRPGGGCGSPPHPADSGRSAHLQPPWSRVPWPQPGGPSRLELMLLEARALHRCTSAARVRLRASWLRGGAGADSTPYFDASATRVEQRLSLDAPAEMSSAAKLELDLAEEGGAVCARARLAGRSVAGFPAGHVFDVELLAVPKRAAAAVESAQPPHSPTRVSGDQRPTLRLLVLQQGLPSPPRAASASLSLSSEVAASDHRQHHHSPPPSPPPSPQLSFRAPSRSSAADWRSPSRRLSPNDASHSPFSGPFKGPPAPEVLPVRSVELLVAAAAAAAMRRRRGGARAARRSSVGRDGRVG